jgi:hypothetical protein
MDENFYIIIIIGLTILIIFFGGHNYQRQIEYDIDGNFFKVFSLIKYIEIKLQNLNNKIEYNDKNFVNIDDKIMINEIIIPNFTSCFYIKIDPYSLFNIFNIINYDQLKNYLIIIFNHNKYSDLEILINNDTLDLYSNEQFKSISISNNVISVAESLSTESPSDYLTISDY